MTLLRRAHTFWAFAVVGVLLLVAGCGSDSSGGKWDWLPTTTGGPATDSTTVAPPVHYPEPKDRDPAAVMAALRQLDPCALIDDKTVGSRAGFPAGASAGAPGPHRCEYSDNDPDNTGTIVVAAGEMFGHGQRYGAAPVDLGGGARAYQRDSTALQTDDRRTCDVDIPVSFTLAVNIQAKQGKRTTRSDVCGQARAFAAIAATKLANPDAIRADPAHLSALVQWDACALLRAGLPPDQRERVVPSGAYYHTGIDECADKKVTVGQVMLLLSYRESPLLAMSKDTKQFNGVTIKESGDNDGCELQWAHGTLSDAKPGSKLAPYIQIRGHTCTQIEGIATAAMNLLAGAPPAATPQRPLLIPTTEQDDPALGPCVDFINSSVSGYDGCAPAQDQPVPDGARDLVDAVAGNADVLCAAAKPMVSKHFGDTLRPVTAGDKGKRYCSFVEATHTVVVTVGVDMAHSPMAYGSGSGVTKSADVTIDGHRGISIETYDTVVQRKDFAVYVTALGSTTGTVWVSVTANRARGASMDSAPDTGKSSLLMPLATDFLTRRFN